MNVKLFEKMTNFGYTIKFMPYEVQIIYGGKLEWTIEGCNFSENLHNAELYLEHIVEIENIS